MTDYLDHTGASVTLCDPPQDLYYAFRQGVLLLVDGRDPGEPPDCVFNFVITGPANPEAVTSLEKRLPKAVELSPYIRQAIEHGTMARLFRELALKEEEAGKRALFEGNSRSEEVMYAYFARLAASWVRSQVLPTRPIRADV